MADQLGTLLRRLRRQAGLTQEQLETRSGVSVRTIRRLENGRSGDHRLGTVNLLADALGAGPDDRRLLVATLTEPEAEPAGEPAPAPDRGQDAPRIPGPSPEPVPAEAPAPHAGRAPTASAVNDELVSAATELAREIRRRWRSEEEHRKVHDPFPLPVRWKSAPELLTDRPMVIQRQPPGTAPGSLDLIGELGSVAKVYRRIGSGRLVVLGRAGSGKSILTIRFVLDQLEAREPHDRVPVLFSIGSWDPTAVALRDWLVDRLVRDHPDLTRRTPNGSMLATALVDADLVLPVLDGFDELAEGLRSTALKVLNATSLPLVLTTRSDEFAEAVQEAGSPLIWAAGLELTGLTLKDLSEYLPLTARALPRGNDGTAPVWPPVLDRLHAGASGTAALTRVLSTPLMVALARTMYSEAPDRNPAELLDTERFPDENAIEEHLLAGFVPSVYGRPVADRDATGRQERRYDPERAERWLGFLAHHLARLDGDQQDLAWWRIGDSQRMSVRLMSVAVSSALCVALAVWIVSLVGLPSQVGEVLVSGCLTGTTAGLAFGCVHSILTRFGSTAFEPAHVRLRLPGGGATAARRPVRTFVARFGAVLPGGVVMGAGCAVALSVQRWLYYGVPIANEPVLKATLINVLVLGLILGTAAGLVFGAVAMLEAPLDVSSAATPANLLASNRTTVIRQVLVLVPMLTATIAVGGRLIAGLLEGIFGPLVWDATSALVIGAVGGIGGTCSYALSFTAWGRWLVLSRVWLPLSGKLPWDTVVFLDDAYRRGALRQAGAVYQFRHIRLQHHLARSYREHQRRYAPARFPPRV
ncbi:helix-turn-helix domain-containing protein [Streptomyces sp. NBC_01420]|uniref:helix-turn-helix domain-containing protein n=1 Tax=Streptomyces sp. NBC_01420 TaxID=2903858 RepID=UPI0032443878